MPAANAAHIIQKDFLPISTSLFLVTFW